jgi:hypothetical protein
MLIGDELYKSAATIEKAVIEMLVEVWNNQTHPQDLLLIQINGNYNTKLSHQPLVGADLISHANTSQYQYIDWYRKQQFNGTLEQYLKHVAISEQNALEEYHSVHHELLVYQKFWELDRLQKILYQLSRLIRGEVYDWHKKIDAKAKKSIESSLKHFKKPARMFYDLCINNYKSSRRNSIAHSTFFFAKRSIVFLNEEGDIAEKLPFEEWRKIIETTLHLHNQIFGRLDSIQNDKRDEAKKNGDFLPVRVIDVNGQSLLADVSPHNNRWVWTASLKSEVKN